MHKFIFKQAETEADLQAIYKLRYHIYCTERGFESPKDHPHGIETDKYDTVSRHFMAMNGAGELIGTARLILQSPLGLPMLEHCKLNINLENIPHDNIAEISRLAISKTLRRREQDDHLGLGDPEYYEKQAKELGIENRRSNPEIVLGLYKLLYLESKWLGIENWVCAMEKSLQILLRRHGAPFTQIGDEVDYHGKRAPYIARVSTIERTMAKKRPEIFQFLTGWQRNGTHHM